MTGGNGDHVSTVDGSRAMVRSHLLMPRIKVDGHIALLGVHSYKIANWVSTIVSK